MTAGTPAELRRLIAAEFDRQGWEYGLIGSDLTDVIKTDGSVDGRRLAGALPNVFFQRNRTTKQLVAAAIEQAIGGRTMEEEAAVPTTIQIGGTSYQLNVGARAFITNSNFNVGEGIQVNVNADANKDDLLVAVEAILRAGLTDEWNPEAARDLASVIGSRDDVDVEDIRRVTVDVVQAEQPKQGRVKSMIDQIAAEGLGGVLSAGMLVGLGELVSQLPL